MVFFFFFFFFFFLFVECELKFGVRKIDAKKKINILEIRSVRLENN